MSLSIFIHYCIDIILGINAHLQQILSIPDQKIVYYQTVHNLGENVLLWFHW